MISSMILVMIRTQENIEKDNLVKKMVVRPSLGEKSKGNHEFFREGVTKYKHPLLESTIPCAYK